MAAASLIFENGLASIGCREFSKYTYEIEENRFCG